MLKGRLYGGTLEMSFPSIRTCPSSGGAETGNHTQGSGLTAAGRSEKCYKFSFFYVEIDVIEHFFVERLGDMLEFDDDVVVIHLCRKCGGQNLLKYR